MTHNNDYLCTSMPWEVEKPIIQNAGAFYLQPRCMSIITVQTPMDLNSQHFYELDTSDDLLDGLIPFSQKVNHNYHKLLKIPILNTS